MKSNQLRVLHDRFRKPESNKIARSPNWTTVPNSHDNASHRMWTLLCSAPHHDDTYLLPFLYIDVTTPRCFDTAAHPMGVIWTPVGTVPGRYTLAGKGVALLAIPD
jgi:hypothetical protein